MENITTKPTIETTIPQQTVNGRGDVTNMRSFEHAVEGVPHGSNSSLMPESTSVIKYKYELGNTGLIATCSGKDNTTIQYNTKLKSSKEEKQRQNEEIVILESSSLSSETGSWEPVFPPKLYGQSNIPPEVKDSPHKVTSCFIDAATLVDDDNIQITDNSLEIQNFKPNSNMIPSTSQPVPFTNKRVFSENDSEDSLENDISEDQDSRKDLSSIIFEMTPVTEDSLNTFENSIQMQDGKIASQTKEIEHKQTNTEGAYPKSVETVFPDQYVVSSTPPTTMVYIKPSRETESGPQSNTETNLMEMYSQHNNYDRLSHRFEQAVVDESIGNNSKSPFFTRKTEHAPSISLPYVSEPSKFSNSNYMVSNSGNTSTISSRTTEISHVDWERSNERLASEDSEDITYKRQKKYSESSPIISGGVSIEDHLPLTGSNINSPMARRKIENVPIVSGAYIPDNVKITTKSPRQTASSAWVVDMSSSPSVNENTSIKPKLIDKNFKILNSESKSSSNQDCSKSRSSVESESSDKSGQKFFVDLTNLPDPFLTKEDELHKSSEKKNIFSMYIDFGGKSTVKEMPARLTARKHSDSSNPRSLEMKNTIATSKSSLAEQHNTTKSSESVLDTIETSVDKNKDTGMDLFVKLSDLDKPLPKVQLDSINEHCVSETRMTRSIPERTWTDQMTSNSKSTEIIIHSFHSENALSLNRLFPHLKEFTFSRSTPGCLGSRTLSPLRAKSSSLVENEDQQVSDLSEMSSVQSSYCRSVVENSTTEDTSQMSNLIGNSQSQLGQDLLRMFLEEIAPDVVVEVSGRRVKAHKCILSSRCQYFAGILSGGWVESAGNVIVLPTFSYSAVHFALCHIYSGVSTIPDSINILELATIADMLGLEGLKEAIMYHLKVKYCHHFHKPCTVCIVGVLECFPLSSAYGLDELYRKCLKWITKYFLKIWLTKAFATLPRELLEKCLQQHIVHLSVENFVDTVCTCGLIMESLPEARWAETVARMCRRLVSAAAHYAASHLCQVLSVVVALPPEAPCAALQSINECITTAIEFTPPDECCRVYEFLSDLMKEIRPQMATPDLINNDPPKLNTQNRIIISYTNSWRMQCEAVLVRSSPRAVMTQAFKNLSPELRKRLRELGCIMFGSQPKSASSSPFDKRNCQTLNNTSVGRVSVSRSIEINKMRTLFVPYSQKPTFHSDGTKVIQTDNKCKIEHKSRQNTYGPPKVRTTKAQEQRARFNMNHAGASQSQERVNKPTMVRTQKFENTKPRYLEPKRFKEPEKKSIPSRLTQRGVSSSESSRNTSPVLQARIMRNSRAKTSNVIPAKLRRENVAKRECSQTISEDSLAPTTRPTSSELSCDSRKESVNENISSNAETARGHHDYSTYTKKKHVSVKSDVLTTKARSERFCREINRTDSKINAVKTKIPVYVQKESKFGSQECQKKNALLFCNDQNNKLMKVSSSLMSATMSSSAKVVSKAKEAKNIAKTQTKGKGEIKKDRNEIPLMERSGTFVKEESAFGDKTTNIDVV